MQIGIAPTDEAVEKFNDFKFNHKLYYVIYKIQGDKDIVVEKEGPKTAKFAVCATVSLPMCSLLLLFFSF